jgi:hypothetical protein
VNATLNIQDKENIKSILEMFSGQFTKQFIESIYLSEAKNFEKTLDKFLTN